MEMLMQYSMHWPFLLPMLWWATLVGAQSGAADPEALAPAMLASDDADPSVGIDDLRSHRVLALDGSTSDRFLADQGVRHGTVDTLADALDQLAAGNADAVVHDAPILGYAIAEAFSQQLRVLPLELRRLAYGIALPPGSEVREPIDIALIEIIRSNDWNALREAYLGAKY